MKQEINQEDQTKTATKRPKVKWVTCEILVSTSESTCIRFDSIRFDSECTEWIICARNELLLLRMASNGGGDDNPKGRKGSRADNRTLKGNQNKTNRRTDKQSHHPQ